MNHGDPAGEPVRAVFFDVGETLLDRTREYAAWSQWLQVPPHTFSAVFGVVIAQGGTVLDAVRRFRPGESLDALRAQMSAEVTVPPLAECDLYPGARGALAAVRATGRFVGVAGNQPPAIAAELRALDLPVDAVLVSGELGVTKPEPEFFAALLHHAQCPAPAAVYVGDQLDNDVRAARAAGFQAIRVLTGPWGRLVRDATIEAECLAVLDSVADVPGLLRRAVQ